MEVVLVLYIYIYIKKIEDYLYIHVPLKTKQKKLSIGAWKKLAILGKGSYATVYLSTVAQQQIYLQACLPLRSEDLDGLREAVSFVYKRATSIIVVTSFVLKPSVHQIKCFW